MNKAVSLVAQWNKAGFISQTIKVNVPQVWVFEPGTTWAGRKTLVEPFIENYKKSNSNTGWADTSTSWHLVMQAISHYSYHISSGEYILCDMQGGIYTGAVVLTDPVILSRQESYGVTDLGLKGISSFFSQHRCNQYCRGNWIKPADRTRYYAPRMGSTMITGTAITQPAPPLVLRRQTANQALLLAMFPFTRLLLIMPSTDSVMFK